MKSYSDYLRSNWVLFFIIFTANFILRFTYAGLNSFWFDECLWVDVAENSPAKIIEICIKNDPNPPLYPLILHYWIECFGHGETAIRLLTILSTSLAAGVLFLMSKKFFNLQTAIIVSFLFFTSNEMYYYAQEARPYGLIILFAVLSYYFFLRLVEKPDLISVILLGLFNAVLFYLHLLAVFCILGQVIMFPILAQRAKTIQLRKRFLEFDYRLDLKLLSYYLLSWGVFFLLFLPWKKRFMALMKPGSFPMWQQKPHLRDLKQCVYEFFNSKELYQVHIYSFLLFLIAIILFKRFRDENFSPKKLLFALVIGPVLIYLNYQVALHVSPIFLKRYVLFTILGFMLAYAYVFSAVKVPFAVKLVLILTLSFFSFKRVQIPREIVFDYKNAVYFLKQAQTEHTLITNDITDLFAFYYSEEAFKIKDFGQRINYLNDKHNVYTVFDNKWPDIIDFSKFKDVYYTMSFEGYRDPGLTVEAALRKKLILVGNITNYKGIKILHFVNPHFKG